MKNLSEKVCCVAFASLLASCAVSGEPAPTPQVQTTPEALAIDAADLLKKMAEFGKSVVYVRGNSVACACSPTVVPNHPGPPPPPWDIAALRRAIQALQVIEKGYETNTVVTIQAPAQH